MQPCVVAGNDAVMPEFGLGNLLGLGEFERGRGGSIPITQLLTFLVSRISRADDAIYHCW
jgi:hypothetical protein